MLPIGEGVLNEPTFWQPGIFQSERLVNMAHHNYREEPNVRFPDKLPVFFTSNMFGPSYVFGVRSPKPKTPPRATSNPHLSWSGSATVEANSNHHAK